MNSSHDGIKALGRYTTVNKKLDSSCQ